MENILTIDSGHSFDTRNCYSCGEDKDMVEFKPQAKSRRHNGDGYLNICRVCYRFKWGYHGTSTRRKEVREAKRDWLSKIKTENGCYICGYNIHGVCIDFHHIKHGKKEDILSSMTHWSWEKIDGELDKCITLCSNCHRAFHAGLIEDNSLVLRPLVRVIPV